MKKTGRYRQRQSETRKETEKEVDRDRGTCRDR